MAKVFEWQSNKGIIDTVSNTQLTNTGVTLKNTIKGLSGSFGLVNTYLETSGSSGLNSSSFTITIGVNFRGGGSDYARIYSRDSDVFEIALTTTGQIRYYSPGFGWINSGVSITRNKFVFLTFTYNSTILTIFVDGLLVYSSNKTISLSGAIRIGNRKNSLASGDQLPGYIVLLKQFNTVLSQQEINNEYKQFLSLQPLQPPKTNLLKESNRSQFNFDLLTTNSVLVPSSSMFGFGSNPFSIYWEDSYPQTQSLPYGGIIECGDTLAGAVDGSWGIYHSNTTVNTLVFRYSVGFPAINSITLISNIQNGEYKFLLTEIGNVIKFYINGAVVYTTNIANHNLKAFNLLLKTCVLGRKSSGNFKNVKLWKGQVLTWQQATGNYKNGLVLDLPMDEGQGLTCYDKSGNGNNGTITTTTGKPWKKIQVKSNIVFKDSFEFDKADGTNITPRGWIKGTGNYKLVTETTGNSIVKKGQNYLECTSEFIHQNHGE